MPRVRKDPVNPFIQSLMDKHGCQTIKELTGIYPELDYTQLLRYADIVDGKGHAYFESLRRTATALHLTVDEFIDQLLSDSQRAS